MAGLPSLGHLEAGMGQLGPLGRTRGKSAKKKKNLLPPAFPGFVSTSFLPFVKVQGKGFFKEQIKREVGVEGEEKNRKEEGSQVW